MRTRILKLTRLPGLGEVQAARARVAAARTRWRRTRLANCTPGIKAQAHAHPLASVGAVAGAGLTLGWLGVGPWRLLEAGVLTSARVWPLASRLLAMARNAGRA